MINDLSPSAANEADTDGGNQAADAEGTTVSSPPSDTPLAKPKVSRRCKAPRSNTSHRKVATSSAKASQPHRATTRAEVSKADLVLRKLRLARGVTVAQIMEATGWQPHSVRGFLSAVVRKKLGLDLTSEVGKDAVRRYRVVEDSRNVGGTGEAG